MVPPTYITCRQTTQAHNIQILSQTDAIYIYIYIYTRTQDSHTFTYRYIQHSMKTIHSYKDTSGHTHAYNKYSFINRHKQAWTYNTAVHKHAYKHT